MYVCICSGKYLSLIKKSNLCNIRENALGIMDFLRWQNVFLVCWGFFSVYWDICTHVCILMISVGLKLQNSKNVSCWLFRSVWLLRQNMCSNMLRLQSLLSHAQRMIILCWSYGIACWLIDVVGKVHKQYIELMKRRCSKVNPLVHGKVSATAFEILHAM